MSARARIMVFRDIVLSDGGSDDIVDALCKPFSIGGAKNTGYDCVYTSAVTHGSLSPLTAPIKRRRSQGAYVYTSDVTIVPSSGYGLPASLTSVSSSPAASSYTYSNGKIRLKWTDAPAANATATITATCPETVYRGAVCGRAVSGIAVCGTE